MQVSCQVMNFEFTKNMKMNIRQYIDANRLQPADVIVVKKIWGILDHYLVYLGRKNGEDYFMANLTLGVKMYSSHELYNMASTYEPIRIRRFKGNDYERKLAVNRALSRKDEDSYNLILNNCEHFANHVQEGESYSRQSQIGAGIGIGLLLLGLGMALFGEGSDDDDKKNYR